MVQSIRPTDRLAGRGLARPRLAKKRSKQAVR